MGGASGEFAVRAPARVRFSVGGLSCLCVTSLEVDLRRAYRASRWVYDALGRQSGAHILRGRRPVVAGVLRAGVPAVVKRLHHGGALARFSGDRFASSARVLNAVAMADLLTAHGLETPEVLFAAWRRVRGFVRAELGVRRVADAMDASDLLFSRRGLPLDWEETVAAIARLVARMHAVGVLHGDLNLMNFLVAPGGRVLVLDLDKATRRAALGTRARRTNLARLERSVRKQGRRAEPSDVERVVETLHGAYLAADA